MLEQDTPTHSEANLVVNKEADPEAEADVADTQTAVPKAADTHAQKMA